MKMELFYRQYGQGNAVIILHGLLGISDRWIPFARRLSDKQKVYIPDLRNHGRSPHNPIFDYPTLVDDIAEFIRELTISKPVIMAKIYFEVLGGEFFNLSIVFF